jgi:hypothetical protein
VAGQEVRAREAGDVRVLRGREQLCGPAELAETALDEHADAVGERCCVLEVVRDEQRGKVELLQQVVKLGADAAAGMRVEGGQRLVQEQDAGVAGKRARERHALPLASGQLGRPRPRQMADLEALEQPI